MASLYLAEFGGLVKDKLAIPSTPPLVEQKLTIGAETDSAVFNPETTVIRVHVDAICSIAFGAAPTASTSTMRLAANQTEYFGVRSGDKLSVITNT
jgi:hypothetical protein